MAYENMKPRKGDTGTYNHPNQDAQTFVIMRVEDNLCWVFYSSRPNEAIPFI